MYYNTLKALLVNINNTKKGIKMASYKKWTEAEINFIRNNHETMPDEHLAAKLSQISNENITTTMIRRQRRKLKIKKERGRPSKIKKLEQKAQEPATTSN